MVQKGLSLPSLAPLLLLFLFSSSGGILKLANGQEETWWCVAKSSSSEAELAANIQYACENVPGGCPIIREGGSCYYPNTAINHASVAMNLYYQLMGRNSWNCDFTGSALKTVTDPSYGSCQYYYA